MREQTNANVCTEAGWSRPAVGWDRWVSTIAEACAVVIGIFEQVQRYSCLVDIHRPVFFN
jgi:hypothetical protein